MPRAAGSVGSAGVVKPDIDCNSKFGPTIMLSRPGAGLVAPPSASYLGTRMSYAIKHLELGGILDQAIAILRDHFVLLLTIMAILVLPFLLAQQFLALAIRPDMPPNPTMQDMMQAQQAQLHY